MNDDVLLVKGADEEVCRHAGEVCVETESCLCPCPFCLAEADEAPAGGGLNDGSR